MLYSKHKRLGLKKSSCFGKQICLLVLRVVICEKTKTLIHVDGVKKVGFSKPKSLQPLFECMII